jgi:hypothetical protein
MTITRRIETIIEIEHHVIGEGRVRVDRNRRPTRCELPDRIGGEQ